MMSLLTKIITGIVAITLALFITTSVAYATAPNVTGRVITSGTNAPVVGVWVRWDDSEGNFRHQKTDSNGRFYFDYWAEYGMSRWEGEIYGNIDSDLNGSTDTKQSFLTEQTKADHGNGYWGGFDCDTNPNKYSVVRPAGWGGSFTSKNVTLQCVTGNLDIGDLIYNPPSAKISGTVFIDTNRNGTQDSGESTYQGATVRLTGVVSSNTTTNNSGAYTFNTLSYGNYSVAVTVPSGYVSTTTSPVSLALSSNQTVNFGIAPNYTISGNVFLDNNANGVRDSGENAYTGATITRSGTSTGTTTSNGSGNYTFTNLNAGSYTVAVTIPSGYTNTTPLSVSRTLGPNGTVNFGIVQYYSISGVLFDDVNNNGVKDVGESNYNGRPSVTASRGTVTTTTSGGYTISNLTPGTVTVSLNTLPAGYNMTYPLNGPPPSFQVTVGPGCGTNGAKGASCQ